MVPVDRTTVWRHFLPLFWIYCKAVYLWKSIKLPLIDLKIRFVAAVSFLFWIYLIHPSGLMLTCEHDLHLSVNTTLPVSLITPAAFLHYASLTALKWCRIVCDITIRKHLHLTALIWPLTSPLCRPDSKLLLWWRLVPSLLPDSHSHPLWREVGGSRAGCFQAQVDSRTPPQWSWKSTQGHTLPHSSPDRLEDCVSAAFLWHPAPIHTPFLVWVLMKRGDPWKEHD